MRGLAGLLLGAALVATPALAASEREWNDCAYGAPDVAIRVCSDIIARGGETRANRSLAFSNRGNAYEKRGDRERALADAEEAIRIDSGNANAYNNRGWSLYRRKQYDAAIADFSQAIRIRPTYALAYNNRGLAYAESGRGDLAIADYGQAIRYDARNAWPHNNRGLVYHDRGDYDRAIADFDDAIRLDPKYVFAYNNRGRAWREKKDAVRAIADYDVALRLDPNYAIAYNNRGLAYADRGDKDQALSDYGRAIGLDPNYAAPRYNRGLIMNTRNEFDAAIADFTEAVRIDPNYAYAFASRGASYSRKGEYDRALADFDRAIALRRDSENYYFADRARAHADRAERRAHAGDLDGAVADADKAAALDPKLAVAPAVRGYVFARRGLSSQAQKEIASAQAIDPKAAATLLYRGEIRLLGGQARDALADFESLLARDPNARFARAGRDAAAAALSPAVTSPTGAPPGVAAAVAPADQTLRRVALVIGNGEYANPRDRLPTPPHDADAMGKLFRDAGFTTVEVVTDLTVDAMRKALRNFSDVAGTADIAVVFYAGHGIELQGRNYLVPVDAQLRFEIDADDQAVSLDRVLDVLKPAKRLRLVILDACRNNPLKERVAAAEGKRSLGAGGLKDPKIRGDNTLVAFAAKEGTEALDGAGNSPFTAALLKYLTRPGLDVELALREVRDDVLDSTNNFQEPSKYGSMGRGIFTLGPARAP